MATYTLGQRLELIMKALDKNQREFAEDFGISYNSLGRYKRNERMPDPEFLSKLADLKINLNWLIKGEGGMYVQVPWEVKSDNKKSKRLEVINGKVTLKDSVDAIYNRTIMFPVSAEISAGTPIEAPENYEPLQHIEIPRTYLKDKVEEYILFRVNGQSMEPNIEHNDLVLVKRCDEWRLADNKVCAIRVEGGVTLKRVQLDPQRAQVLLHPFNLDFRVQILDSFQNDDLFLIGTIALQLRLY